ncbi:MAG: response regulator [bacterium]
MKKRILVCDDDKQVRLMLTMALKDIYEIEKAVDGQEAVQKVAEKPIDLIIMDIKMPGIHGLEAIERIREKNKTIPIIIITAYGLMQDDFVVKSSGIAHFFTKPIEIKALKEKIFEIIGE